MTFFFTIFGVPHPFVVDTFLLMLHFSNFWHWCYVCPVNNDKGEERDATLSWVSKNIAGGSPILFRCRLWPFPIGTVARSAQSLVNGNVTGSLPLGSIFWCLDNALALACTSSHYQSWVTLSLIYISHSPATQQKTIPKQHGDECWSSEWLWRASNVFFPFIFTTILFHDIFWHFW